MKRIVKHLAIISFIFLVGALGAVQVGAEVCDGASDCQALELLNADFEEGADGFVYGDDPFWDTNQGRYAHGKVLPDGGFEDSAGLNVKLGNVDGRDIFDGISGGWTKEFHLNEAAAGEISLRYRLTTVGFDEDECSIVEIAVDGEVVNPDFFDGDPMFEPLCGRGHDTGWRQVTLAFTNLAAGNHSITIGGSTNQKTAASEVANLYFDDVVVTVASTQQESEQICDDDIDNDGDGDSDCNDSDCDGAPACQEPLLINADFEEGAQGFDYRDDTFLNTNQGRYAHGDVQPDRGYEGSAGLYVRLGGVDGRDIYDGISGGWSAGFDLDEAVDAGISFRYRLTTEGFDAGECGQVLVAVDGEIVQYVDRLCGRGYDTGWRQVNLMRSLSAGHHEITIGGYNNQKTSSSEIANLYFDDVRVSTKGAVQPMVAAAYNLSVGLKSDGTAVAVGSNEYGEREVDDWTGIVQVAAGGRSATLTSAYTLGLRSDGTVVVAGGHPIDDFIEADSWTDIVQISVGNSHAVALKSDGTVVADGDGTFGELNVGSWTNIVQVAAGSGGTVGLKSDGTVVFAGSNSSGEGMDAWTEIIQVASGGGHVLGLKSDGTVMHDGGLTDDYDQRLVGTWPEVIQITADYHYATGLKPNGTVAVASRASWFDPLDELVTWNDIVQVGAGSEHVLGLKSDGTVQVMVFGDHSADQADVEGWGSLFVAP